MQTLRRLLQLTRPSAPRTSDAVSLEVSGAERRQARRTLAAQSR
jgi:hypothetical protein